MNFNILQSRIKILKFLVMDDKEIDRSISGQWRGSATRGWM